MYRDWTLLLPLATVALVVIPLAGLACSESAVTETSKNPTEWLDYSIQTPSYRIMLKTGPRVSMAVMQMGATMTAVDRGQPVNHHLEVHIFDRSTGSEVKDLLPTVRITDPATGESREFGADVHPAGQTPYVKACLLSNHRASEPHFGDNLYLRDGTYTVTVSVGNEGGVAKVSVVETTG